MCFLRTLETLRLTFTTNSKRQTSNILRNISNPTMRTGLDFKSAQFDPVRGEAEHWIKLRGLEI